VPDDVLRDHGRTRHLPPVPDGLDPSGRRQFVLDHLLGQVNAASHYIRMAAEDLPPLVWDPSRRLLVVQLTDLVRPAGGARGGRGLARCAGPARGVADRARSPRRRRACRRRRRSQRLRWYHCREPPSGPGGPGSPARKPSRS
jgi:hypothetical protein